MATESKVALQEIVSTNPADGSVVGRFPVADSAQVHAVVERARRSAARMESVRRSQAHPDPAALSAAAARA